MKKHTIDDINDLSKLLALSEVDATHAKIKSDIMEKIRDLIQKQQLTHLEVSKRTGVGRTVITQIVNASIQRITIDRLLRVVIALGVRPTINYKSVS